MSRIIVITGGGSGLGRAIARRRAKAGDTLVLLGRTFSKLQAVAEEVGHGALAIQCDITDPQSVRDAFATIAKTHPKIDVLINNAGVFSPFAIATATDEQIQSTIATNLNGPIYCSRAAIPMMEKGGHIINISSESIGENFFMLSLYQCAKAGLEHFTGSLRGEVAKLGIRVTTVRAGQMMDEDMVHDRDPETAQAFAMGNIERGIDLRNRPISHFDSVATIFDSVLDLPDDVHVPVVRLSARHP